MRQLAILLLRLFPFLTLPNKAAINVLEQASMSPVCMFLLGGEKKWNRCIIRYVHSGLSQISLTRPLHNPPLICTPASIQPGRLQRFISQTPPHQIYRLSQTSPFSASEACTLLTSSSPWKFSPSLGIQENPHLDSATIPFKSWSLTPHSVQLVPALQPCCLEVNFPRGMAQEAKNILR